MDLRSLNVDILLERQVGNVGMIHFRDYTLAFGLRNGNDFIWCIVFFFIKLKSSLALPL